MFVTKRGINGMVIEECDLESLIMVQIQLEMIAKGFVEKNYTPPDFLLEKIDSLSLLISERTKQEKLRKLRLLKMKREGLTTRQEQREQADAEIARLEKELA